ncbi:hypothetical protein PJ985_22480 [Streptomyces sp. ACA25]|uniref:hypothetical protein n=1 Tax=Streptomyces sp. ACA25 TaxID=3022596 RepID=UPI002307459A|nr:hypothetical protein [Streptomyces sp. ACA25]MDB1090321.1 hypothetical protein [Streptomyces sp. ACA25]
MGEAVERVDPSGIPEFTGDVEQLESDHASLKSDAGTIRGIGSSVHTRFQGLSAFYQAPEAEQLFATTRPVRDRADDFAGDLETVSGALKTYTAEIRPLVAKLARLKTEARTFVNSIADDDDWRYDGSKVDRNNELVREISTTVAEFWAAERTAANTIIALWGGTQWAVDDGSGAANMYGLSTEEMAQAGETPWGQAVEKKHRWYAVHQHVKSFVWDGLIVDGIWGTLTGLGGLVGLQGFEVFKESWKGLGQLATGLVLISTPLALVTHQLMPDGPVKDWMDDSLHTTKEVGKSLLAWDEWSENPARAAGLVTFNVLTTVATLGVGTAIKTTSAAGNAAKVANVAGRIGLAIDPMTYIGRGLGTGLSALPKLTDVTAGLKNLTTVKGFELPDGTLRLPDGTTVPPGAALPDLPPGSNAVELPDGSVRLPDGTTLHPDGRLQALDGHTAQTPDQIPAELSATDRALLNTNDPTHLTPEPALTGAHQPGSVTAQVGDGVPASPARDLSGGPTTQIPEGPPGGPAREVPGDPRTGTGSPGAGGSGDLSGGAGPPREGTPRNEASPGTRESGAARMADDSAPSSGDQPSRPASEGSREGRDGGGESETTGDHPDNGPQPAAGGEDPPGTQAHEAQGNGTPDFGDPGTQHPALPAGETQRTLAEVRALRDSRERWQAGEEYVRDLYGAGPERHYPVAPNQDPSYPVTSSGGRKVDAPVDLPDGRTVAVEVKTYQEYRTVKLADGTNQVVQGEVPLSKHIKEQIHKDVALRAQDPQYDPRWVFVQAPPSAELRAYLVEARIIFVEYGRPTG